MHIYKYCIIKEILRFKISIASFRALQKFCGFRLLAILGFFKWAGTGGTKNQSGGAHEKSENSTGNKYWLSKHLSMISKMQCPVP